MLYRVESPPHLTQNSSVYIRIRGYPHDTMDKGNRVSEETDRRQRKELDPVTEIDLHEKIGAGQGHSTSVSILRPHVRIERSANAPSDRGPEEKPYFRIILTFTLQVNILGFDSQFVCPRPVVGSENGSAN